MRKVNILQEQRIEMTNTFVTIRKKIADAQVAIRNLNAKSKTLEEQRDEAEKRYLDARKRCTGLRDQIADRESDLSDIENQIPLVKSKMHELESMYGENKYFEKILERTRKEVMNLEKRRQDMHERAKQKSEECWQAKQKMHKLELRLESIDRNMDVSFRRIIIAQEKLAAVGVQSKTVSKNYTELSKSEMEKEYLEKKQIVSEAKERRKASEEKVTKLEWHVEEIDKQVQIYQSKMREMFNGQRELASSKLL